MNSVTRMPPQGIADPAQQWFWDGSSWQCGCGDGGGFPPFGPPVFSGPVNQPPWYPGANGGVSFGTVAPPNPVRGHFWWDGTVLWMFDGAAWVATGGASGGTTPPSATAPSNPVNGQQWFNGTTLYVWDGNAWVPVSQTKTTISATAPPGPNPGDLWFNGTQLYIWSGSVWNLVGPGATVGPVPTTTHVFSMRQTAGAATVPLGTGSPVNFTATPIIDTQKMYDPVTQKIMPKVAGNYHMFTRHQLLTTETYATHVMVKNDTGSFATAEVLSVAGMAVPTGQPQNVFMTSSGLSYMNGTTDFMRLYGWASDNILLPPPNASHIDIWLMP